MFPKARYVLLEDPDIQDRVRNDPRAFLDEIQPPVVFDEIQNAPELLGYVRTLIDPRPRRMGQWLFTGSQEAPLMHGITESMAGRAAILQLLAFSLAETGKADLLHGGFPEALARPNPPKPPYRNAKRIRSEKRGSETNPSSTSTARKNRLSGTTTWRTKSSSPSRPVHRVQSGLPAPQDRKRSKCGAVEVRGLTPEDSCADDMLALIRWHGRNVALPLSQLVAIDADESTLQAIGDCLYWRAQGYCF